MCIVFFFELYRGHRDLHVLTHSFPTRRSSDLELADDPPNAGDARIVLFGPHRLPRDLGVLPHRAQFHDVEALIIQPHPTLAIERRPAALELDRRSEEHTSELQSLMRISYAVFCLKKKKTNNTPKPNIKHHQTE